MDSMNTIWRDFPQLTAEQPSTSSIQPKRKCYSFAFKLEILNFAKKTSVRKASQTFGVDRSCIRDWKKQENKLLLASQNHKGVFKCRKTGTEKDKVGLSNAQENPESNLTQEKRTKSQPAAKSSDNKSSVRTNQMDKSHQKFQSPSLEEQFEAYVLHTV
uniref:Brinker DNA-binding domain-containing protein n=1 Tax=Ditylenchus dipsaci TaxID=166011 RepID=A0A915DAV5_9BILA